MSKFKHVIIGEPVDETTVNWKFQIDESNGDLNIIANHKIVMWVRPTGVVRIPREAIKGCPDQGYTVGLRFDDPDC